MPASSSTSRAAGPDGPGAATPTVNTVPLNPGAFATLAEALDYAAEGHTGLNFHDARGRLTEALPYGELRRRALTTARRLLGLGLQRGERVAVIAETASTFPEVFFACQYAGLVPVALPVSLNLGGRQAYVEQIRGLLERARPGVALASEAFSPFLEEAASGMDGVRLHTPASLAALEPAEVTPEPTRPEEIAYLQFTSGSTQAPRGVVIRAGAVMSNLQGIVRHGLGIHAGDRCASWLPFYHDMGMVGLLLGPLASQRSVDYMGTRDFAVRPVQWLKLISRNGGSVAFAPPFGYDLCARRVRDGDVEQLDLSRWRVAGVGAELVRPEPLRRFAERLAPAGFGEHAFRACYGLAEASLAVTFAPAGAGLEIDRADAEAMAAEDVARTPGGDGETRELVVCGEVLPGHEVVIRDPEGAPLPQGHIGHVTVRGPSLMSGYYNDRAATREALDADGWLYTGDLGYLGRQGLVITGRHKDLIIINGRNLWPEDLEQAVEQEPDVRTGDVSAFAVDDDGGERVVLVLQCRLTGSEARTELRARVQARVQAHFGVSPEVDLVGAHTLPRTSSGKLSRSRARQDYLARQAARAPEPAQTGS
ncbi:fatty acyl-AMP ligase [Arhodomonas aquaeolei]|uniref:fatty acyl-AMP ligase n=1 Tax=Arhodomonas aquaeolei TaxID=2369 RepID=UPI0021683421|nr:fatty acyl-AMP ligase [Arhodomonas aquaeolei]MCS4503128.1 fatty acyl-AMP ligase [Arhodomonas aquaeolei]